MAWPGDRARRPPEGTEQAWARGPEGNLQHFLSKEQVASENSDYSSTAVSPKEWKKTHEKIQTGILVRKVAGFDYYNHMYLSDLGIKTGLLHWL